MQSFKAHILEEDAVADAKKRLKTMKGKQVSFTHQSSGKKVTGTYQGMKQMGGRSYAHIETGKGAHRVPPHHIHQANESVMYEANLPGAETLGKHAGHVTKHGIAKLGTKKKIRPDGSAELKLKLVSHKTTDSAHGEANKAADNLKKKGYTVHKVSVRKSQSAYGEPEHTASIHLSHGG
jgi:hypothetical protein